jgi:hypothetical protein
LVLNNGPAYAPMADPGNVEKQVGVQVLQGAKRKKSKYGG